MILLDHITKTYNKGDVTAVQDISLDIKEGEIFGLIGPDGAGKTTLFRILTTLLLADEGNASVNGHDVVKDYKKIRNEVGYMPGKFSLYQDLTVEENLQFFATIFDTTIEENYELIRDIYVQIEPFKTRYAGQLSGGMKQKLALCCALIHKPVVLFLDEPTTGVDSVSRKEFWEMLKNLKAQGITIMVSTPYMDEANLCDRIALIQKGTILSVNSPADIVKAYPMQLFGVKTSKPYKVMTELRNHPMTNTCFAFGDSLHVTFKENILPEDMSRFLQSKGLEDVHIEVIQPGIEDEFIHLLKS